MAKTIMKEWEAVSITTTHTHTHYSNFQLLLQKDHPGRQALNFKLPGGFRSFKTTVSKSFNGSQAEASAYVLFAFGMVNSNACV